MLLTADRIPATQALSMGLVDELASPRDLLSAAARRAQALQARISPKCARNDRSGRLNFSTVRLLFTLEILDK